MPPAQAMKTLLDVMAKQKTNADLLPRLARNLEIISRGSRRRRDLIPETVFTSNGI